MKINDLIKKIRQENGYTYGMLSNKLGVSEAFLSNVEKDKKKVSKKLFEKLIKAFPLYKETLEKSYIQYLLDNKKIELDTNQNTINNEEKEESNLYKEDYENFLKVPLYGMASAGSGRILDEDEEVDFIVLPTLKGNLKKSDFATKVYGDSMEPHYNHGDIIVIDVSDCDIRTMNGKEAVITYGEERYLKMVHFEKGTGNLILKSYNTAYKDIVIPNYELDTVSCQGVVSMVISMRNKRYFR